MSEYARESRQSRRPEAAERISGEGTLGALPVTLRWYLWAIWACCLALLVAQAPALITLFATQLWHIDVLAPAALFVALAYLGERAMLRVSASTSQSLSTAVYVAVILLFPPPVPLLVMLITMLITQLPTTSLSLYKRLFNLAHSTLLVGLSSLAFAHLATPGDSLRPDRLGDALPAVAALLVLYYLLDVGPMLGVLAILESRSPWAVWRTTYRRTLLPELATSTIGIVAAQAWMANHLLLALFIVPVVALRQAFRAIAEAERRAAVLRQRGMQLEQVLAAGQEMQIERSPEEVLRPAAEAARRIAEAARATAYVTARDGMLTPLLSVPDTPSAMDPIPCPPPRTGIREERAGTERTLLVPLEHERAGVLGLLRLDGVAETQTPDDHEALRILATQVSIALRNARLHARVQAQAAEDGLTGLLNHRAFQTRLEQEVRRASRTGTPLALIMLDLDGFSEVNNEYGHPAGDTALILASAALREQVRAGDVVARYGGDEFAVILPTADLDEALASAERIRAALDGVTLALGSASVRLGASVGVAVFPRHARGRDELVRAADNALYSAKGAGKNRVGRPEDSLPVVSRDPAVLARELATANMATVEALAAAVDAKDSYTRGHSQRVATYAAALAYALGLSSTDVARVRLAGLLHDVGKIGVPDTILTKAGPLDEAEWREVMAHPATGARLLSAVPFLQDVLPAVRSHHERWDGRGYPDGLAGAAIPRDATILAVADAFDAMTSARSYRPALSAEEARSRLRAQAGTQFAPLVVAAFERAVELEDVHIPDAPSHP